MPSPSLLLTLVRSSPQNCRAPRHKNLCAPLHRSLIPPCATHSCPSASKSLGQLMLTRSAAMHRLGRGGAARPAATRRYSCGVAGAPILVAPEIMHSKVELGCGEEVHGLRGAEQHHHLRASSLAAAHLPSFSTSVIPSALACISRYISFASIPPPLASGATAGRRPGATRQRGGIRRG